MRKLDFSLLIIIIILLLSNIVTAVYVVRDDGSWGISLDVQGTDYTVYNSGSWGIELKMEWYETIWYDDYWKMFYNGTDPQYSYVSPSDGEENVSRGTVTLSASIYDLDGDTMNISFYWADNYTLIGENNTVSDGVYSQTIWGNYSDIINWSVNLTDGINWNNQTISFSVENLIPPSSFVASNYNDSTINLTWSKTSNVSHSHIRRSISGYPSSVTSGTLVDNSTNTSFNDTGLDFGTRYNYSIWGWNITDKAFSSLYSTAFAYTNPETPSNLQETLEQTDSITLSWTKGTNASRTVVFRNATGEAGFPNKDNGTEAINTTSNSGTASGLTKNTTYYFTAYSFNPVSGLWSLQNDTDSATTLETADNPTNLVVSYYNDTQQNLTWTKGKPEDETVIRGKKGSYPSNSEDGFFVYNGSSSACISSGLDPASKYYYRAWGWNGEEISENYAQDWNYTLPEPPQDFVGNIDGTDLEITWVKGINASRTIIAENQTTYPTDPEGGDVFYNGTGTQTIRSGVVDINYFVGWSYTTIDGLHFYSLRENLNWGGLEINVYREADPHIEINNYTVFITNSDGSETYLNTSQNNPTRINVNNVPNGEDIRITVSKDGYYPRTIIEDLDENAWYDIDFYLVASPSGGGDPSEDDYVPTSDPESPDYDYNETQNESYAQLYLLLVQDPYGIRLPDVEITIQRYINTTDTWEAVADIITDANGQGEAYLIPDVQYLCKLEKQYYQTSYPYYTPTEDVVTHTFVLYPEDITDPYGGLFLNLTYSLLPAETYHNTSFNISLTVSDLDCNVSYYHLNISWEALNGTGSMQNVYNQNITNSSCGGLLYYNTNFTSAKYTVSVHFKKEGYNEFFTIRTFYLYPAGVPQWNVLDLLPQIIYWIIAIIITIIGTAFVYRVTESGNSIVATLVIFGVFVGINPYGDIGGIPVWLVYIAMVLVALSLFALGRGVQNNR